MSDMISFLKPDFSFQDERGFLYQLCHEGWKQVNVSKTVKGTFRGGHYHKATREAFFIVQGSLQLTLEKGDKSENYTFHEGDFFIVEPLAIHSFQFLDDTLMVALYDIGVEKSDGTKDIFKKGE